MSQVLIIEDNSTMREGIEQILKKMGHDIRSAGGGRDGIRMFSESAADFVITDLKMEEVDGIQVLKEIKTMSPEAILMIITAFGSIETAVEAMKLGAFDFITKPFSPELLRIKVNAAIEFAKTRAENRFLRSEAGRDYPETLIGVSRPLKAVLGEIEKVAASESTVLITGESGTGKELVARAIHAQGPRADKPFIKVDCTSLAEGVLESELFGHERGASSRAIQRRAGRFELADEGTIFLEEVADIPPHIQAKLLKVLQDRSFERVGGSRTLKVNVRMISSTHRDLKDQVRSGKFREDLYHRLRVVPIHLPPLRDRLDDIPVLLEHFLDRIQRRSGRSIRITDDAMVALQAYSWPGNIRELESLVERLHFLSRDGRIDLEALPGHIRTPSAPADLTLPKKGIQLNQALEELERQLILRALRDAQGIKSRTADLLGIKSSALYYKLEKYGIT